MGVAEGRVWPPIRTMQTRPAWGGARTSFGAAVLGESTFKPPKQVVTRNVDWSANLVQRLLTAAGAEDCSDLRRDSAAINRSTAPAALGSRRSGWPMHDGLGTAASETLACRLPP